MECVVSACASSGWLWLLVKTFLTMSWRHSEEGLRKSLEDCGRIDKLALSAEYLECDKLPLACRAGKSKPQSESKVRANHSTKTKGKVALEV